MHVKMTRGRFYARSERNKEDFAFQLRKSFGKRIFSFQIVPEEKFKEESGNTDEMDEVTEVVRCEKERRQNYEIELVDWRIMMLKDGDTVIRCDVERQQCIEICNDDVISENSNEESSYEEMILYWESVSKDLMDWENSVEASGVSCAKNELVRSRRGKVETNIENTNEAANVESKESQNVMLSAKALEQQSRARNDDLVEYTNKKVISLPRKNDVFVNEGLNAASKQPKDVMGSVKMMQKQSCAENNRLVECIEKNAICSQPTKKLKRVPDGNVEAEVVDLTTDDSFEELKRKRVVEDSSVRLKKEQALVWGGEASMADVMAIKRMLETGSGVYGHWNCKLEIKDSLLEGAGKGVFLKAGHTLRSGECVTEYSGKCIK